MSMVCLLMSGSMREHQNERKVAECYCHPGRYSKGETMAFENVQLGMRHMTHVPGPALRYTET